MITGMRTHNDAARGSVMLCVLLFIVAAASIALYAVNDTMNARQVNLREETYANGLSAAEYGAELAISEIAKGLVLNPDEAGKFSDLSTVRGDWVLGQQDGATTLYTSNGVTDPEQRRIAGNFNEHEFRVRVRSTRQAYESNLVGDGSDQPLPAGWLWDPGQFAFNKDKVYSFRDVYEITSTARPRGISEGEKVNAAAYSEPVVQAVIEYQYESPLGSLMSGATLMLEKPENFIPVAAETQVIDHDAPVAFHTTASIQSESAYAATEPIAISGPMQQLKTIYNISVSGEDHDIRKQSIPQVVTDRITTPLRLTTNEARFFNATGSYWTSGILTLNFIDIDDNNSTDTSLKYKDIEVTLKEKESDTGHKHTVRMPVANPHRPYNSNYIRLPSDPADTNSQRLQPIENARNTFYTDSEIENLGNSQSMLNKELAMWAHYQDGRTLDTYLLGGKSRVVQNWEYVKENNKYVWKWVNTTSGMTVTATQLPGNKKIDHTFWESSKQVQPYGTGYITNLTDSSDKFNIVLGAFEDLPRLYINMAHSREQVATGGWAQMYVGQYTKEVRKTTMNSKSAPLLVGTQYSINGTTKTTDTTGKIRPQTIHMVLNNEDRMLVREYEHKYKNGQVVYFAWEAPVKYSYYEHSTTGEVSFNSKNPGANKDEQKLWVKKSEDTTATWEGNYMWCKVTFPGSNQFNMDESENITVYSDDGKSLSVQIKKSGTACVPRQFFWQELVGYSLAKDWSKERYGEPALIEDNLGYKDGKTSSRRTYPFRDKQGNTKSVGFDEAYQRNPKYEGTPRWKPKQLNTELAKLDYPTYLVDAWDPIWVRNPANGQLEDKNSMDDFLFEKEFIIDDETGETIQRDAVCLFIAYEDQTEWNGGVDYNYHDMIFSIYVAPTIEQTVKDKINIAASSKQWWERDEREGLSGRLSHPAIGVNMQGDAGHLSDLELRLDHFKRLGYTEKDPDENENNLAYNIWTMHGNQTDNTIEFPRAAFVYNEKYNTGVLDTKDEIVAMFLAMDGKPKTFYYTKGDLVDYIQLFVKDNKAEEVEKWYDAEKNDWNYDLAVQEISSKNGGMYTFLPIDERWLDKDKDGKDRTERAALTEQKEEGDDDRGAMIVSRDPVVIRKLAADVIGSSVETVPFIRTEGFSKITDAVAESGTLGFIAGEVRHNASFDMLTSGLYSDGEGVPIRSDLLTFPEPIDAAGTYRTDYAKAFFAAPATDMTAKASLDAAAKSAVDMCYVDYYDGDDVTKGKVQNAYGIKEERYSIGFHRSGKEFEHRENNAQDRMEIVGLGVKTFNPYRTTKLNPYYIANEKFGDEEDPSYGVFANYTVDGGVAPTFVFDKPIDGAGAMVVNGNLHIKSTFAYYGILIVLGDLIIEPTKHENEYVYNSEGNPVDEYGYALTRKDPTSKWEYSGSVPVDEEGNPRTNPTPALQTVYRGELIVQGTVAVKGRVITKQTTVGEDGDSSAPAGTVLTGSLQAFWNRSAVEDAGSAFSNGGPKVRRISWTHNDDISVDSIWQDRTDRKNNQ